jgi:hypothetical protein
MHRGNAGRQNDDSDTDEAHRNKKQEMKTHINQTRSHKSKVYRNIYQEKEASTLAANFPTATSSLLIRQGKQHNLQCSKGIKELDASE